MDNLTIKQKSILAELDSARKTVKTDDYSMSVGELISLYKDNEIKLDPAFQRLFRWEDRQKTRLIESILIGIPIPEVFVAQKADGTWHVVDGVQRLSTIFQLVGELKGYDPLQLTSCKYIPSLEQTLWEDLPVSTQREFKKSKVKVNIILTENSDEAQYELFQRLNTGGTPLEDQEVRNCLILMIDPDFYEKINELKRYNSFISCLSMKDHKFDKEFHMELLLRMYIGYEGVVDYSKYQPLGNVLISDFIDKETMHLVSKGDFERFKDVFERTFDKLSGALGKQAFLKYSKRDGSFSGAFNVSAFEMIAVGIASNIDGIERISDLELKEMIKEIYEESVVKESLEHGVKPIIRFRKLTEFSKQYFDLI